MAALTVALIGVGYAQWLTYKAQLAMTRTIERAWISASVSLDEFGPDIAPRVSVRFTNTGRSPAHFKLSRIVFQTMDKTDTLPAVPDYGANNGLPAPATLLQGVGVTSVMGNAKVLPKSIFNGIMSGDIALYIYGACEYTDALDPSKLRVTQFGARLDAELSKRERKFIFTIPDFPNYNEAT